MQKEKRREGERWPDASRWQDWLAINNKGISLRLLLL